CEFRSKVARTAVARLGGPPARRGAFSRPFGVMLMPAVVAARGELLLRLSTGRERHLLARRRGPTPSWGRLLLATPVLLAAPLHAQGSAPARPEHTPADVSFMQDMILHHAQAVVMSEWVPTHGASQRLLVLAKRIALSQRDEI